MNNGGWVCKTVGLSLAANIEGFLLGGFAGIVLKNAHVFLWLQYGLFHFF
jgi:hypothetical protein